MEQLIQALKDDKPELVSTLASNILVGSRGPDWPAVYNLESALPEAEVIFDDEEGNFILFNDKRYSYA